MTARPARPARSSAQGVRWDLFDLRFSIIGRTPCVDQKRRVSLGEGLPAEREGGGSVQTAVWAARSANLRGPPPRRQRCETAGTMAGRTRASAYGTASAMPGAEGQKHSLRAQGVATSLAPAAWG